MEHLKRENTDLRNELEVHKAILNQAQDHRQLLLKVMLMLGVIHSADTLRNSLTCCMIRALTHYAIHLHLAAPPRLYVPLPCRKQHVSF